jgi:hypothetical protein
VSDALDGQRVESECQRPRAPLDGEMLGGLAPILRAPARQRGRLAARAPSVLRSAIARSISARRLLKARMTGRGTPAISAIPFSTGVHSTPSERESSPRNTAW